MPQEAYSLAELMIVATSEAWRGNGEVLASGITPIPRLGASLGCRVEIRFDLERSPPYGARTRKGPD